MQSKKQIAFTTEEKSNKCCAASLCDEKPFLLCRQPLLAAAIHFGYNHRPCSE